MFDGDDFPYWKIRMESYLEACDVRCLKAATEGFTPPANVIPDFQNKTRYTPYVSLKGQISHIATSKG